ncbi:penicillin-binding transpeptidase domain-containing protein [Sinomonas sp. ASV486]|uniref:penicillin-binding transpeptidase domain-containing protein n=1 Tax=Sinomonas sp. ASV486 TaxID=3051170 RepID=UPI0027DE93F3|nr:penicillin-binding transpeptidase domain-containing protein [Sinomonas sp. ASV486]MDQ4491770.1 penicillin-binding transpeptidase domain-containing protein [Sinomonas sp. ASV486]
MGKFRVVSLVLAAALMGAALTSCDDGRQAAAKQAGSQLASAFAARDVSGVPMQGKEPVAAQQQLETALKGIGEVKPAVTAGEPKLDGDKADVALNFDWKLGGQDWTYTTTAQLIRSGDRWLTQWKPDLLAPQLAETEVLTLATQAPPRADILGAGDAKLVTARPVVRVGIDKTKVAADQQADSAAKLADLVKTDPGEYAKQVAGAAEKAFVEAITLRDEASRTPTDEQIAAVPGAITVKDTMPLAPTRTFARPVLGAVGAATAEQVKNSGGAVQDGDTTGSSGLQAQYDSQLRGLDGVTVYAQPADLTAEKLKANPAARRTLFDKAPVPGTPLKTTIDPKLQQIAEDELAGVAPASAIVALRPSDGALLAVASGPGGNGYNTAMLGQYAPGSIFKTVDSLALLRQGGTVDTRVDCTSTLVVDGKTFQNATGYPESSLGNITLRDAYAHSCNTAFISLRDKLSQAQLESAATSLGVAVDAPRLGVPAFLGSVPGDAGSTEHAASMIGQGKILFSPLAAAIMAGSVAKGSLVSAQLVLNGQTGTTAGASPSGTASPAASASAGSTTAGAASSATGGAASSAPAASASPTAQAGPPLNAAEAATLQDMMRAVVTSGHAGFLADVPGAPVGAKTGTAEFGSDTPLKTHAWIIGTHGDLAVAVFVDEGGLGATVSGPLLKNFLVKAAG